MKMKWRRLVAVVLLAVGSLVVLGCSSGLDTSNEDLPLPALHAGDPLSACGTAGGVPVVLDLLRTVVTTGYGGPAPTPVDNVDVRGTVTGLPAGDAVYVAIVTMGSPCQVINSATATVDAATGDLQVFINLRTAAEFHVVAMSGTAAPTGHVTCTVSGCLDLQDDSGTLLTVSGVSNTLDVRLE